MNNTSTVKDIAILRLSALGDCINAFGMIGALKAKYPQLNISFIIDKRFSNLFYDDDSNPLVDLIPVDFKEQGVISSILKLKGELKKNHQKFDALLNMQTSIKSSLCSLAVNATDKYGYDKTRSREGQKFFVNKTIEPSNNKHVLAGFLSFAQAINYPLDGPNWDFKLSEQLILKVKDKLKQAITINSANEVQAKSYKFFALAPCSAKKEKNWTIENYQSVIDYVNRLNFTVILLGGNSLLEQEYCHQLSYNNNKVINLQGKTTLRELAAILTLCSFTLAVDSAPMHLSSALNIPTIGLFAIHNPQRVGPWNFMHLNVSVYEELAKKQLAQDNKDINNIPWRYRVKDENAMSNIKVPQVLDTIDIALKTYESKIIDF